MIEWGGGVISDRLFVICNPFAEGHFITISQDINQQILHHHMLQGICENSGLSGYYGANPKSPSLHPGVKNRGAHSRH